MTARPCVNLSLEVRIETNYNRRNSVVVATARANAETELKTITIEMKTASLTKNAMTAIIATATAVTEIASLNFVGTGIWI